MFVAALNFAPRQHILMYRPRFDRPSELQITSIESAPRRATTKVVGEYTY